MPAKISLNDHLAIAGFPVPEPSPPSSDSCFSRLWSQRVEASAEAAKDGSYASYLATARHMSLFDFLVRYFSRLSPRISWAKGVATLGGSGIRLHLDGKSLGLAADLIQTRCRLLRPTKVHPRAWRKIRLRLRAEERPFAQAPHAALESTNKTFLRG